MLEYVATAQNGPFVKKVTSPATNAGTAVDLTASGLEEYTEYYYYVTVSDSHAEPIQSETQGAVRTMCSGANLTCNGPFIEYEDCEDCGGTGHSSYLVLIWGSDIGPFECPDCGAYDVYPRNYGCAICAGGETTATKLFSIRYCQTCGYQSDDPYNIHHHDSPCKTCNGTGKGTTGTPINCVHGKSATHKYCIHNEMEPHEYDQTELWEYLGRVSKDIATRTDITINNDTERVSGTTEKGELYNIAVGDTFKVSYNNEAILRTVRVIGFKHDNLADKTVYGGNHEKAGISFEFVDFLTNTRYEWMDTTISINGCWATTEMRKRLNGYITNDPVQTRTIGGYAAKLSNANQIKKVKKEYLPKYNNETLSTTPAEDYLWLLSCGEIWSDGYNGGNTSGYARNSEGSQYKYYKTKTNGIAYSSSNSSLVKMTKSDASAKSWWLRSPYYQDNINYCIVNLSGTCAYSSASIGVNYVAPGFSV